MEREEETTKWKGVMNVPFHDDNDEDDYYFYYDINTVHHNHRSQQQRRYGDHDDNHASDFSVGDATLFHVIYMPTSR